MIIKCKCGKEVVEGEIVVRKTKRGDRRRFDIKNKPQGSIIKNNSNNPKDWEGICSSCQSNKNLKGGKSNGRQ